MNLLDPVKWGAQAAFSVTSAFFKIGANVVQTAELLLDRDRDDDAEQRFSPTADRDDSPVDRDRESPGSATRGHRAPEPTSAATIPRGERKPTSVAPPAPEERFEHVDTEATLVETEGAASPSATLRVDEPFDGYDRLKAPEIVSRVRESDGATKAVVRLYESTHKKRKSILSATE